MSQTGGPTVSEPLSTAINIQLNGYFTQAKNVNITTSFSNSILFDKYQLTIDSFNFGGTVISNSSGDAVLNDTFDANIRCYPGRQTLVPLFVDDAMFSLDPVTNLLSYDRNALLARNLDPDTNTINGFLSDFVRFDISNVPNRPLLSDGSAASRIYFSGDNIALSASGSKGLFNVLQPAVINAGQFNPPVDIAGTTAPGTYSLIQDDPRPLSVLAKIASIQGTWKDYTAVTKNLGAFETILFPDSTGSKQLDLAMFARDANGVITNFYYGQADLDTKTFFAYPVGNLVTGDTTGEIQGTLSGYTDRDGAATTSSSAVRIGVISITSALPTGFTASGRFFIFNL